MKKFLCLFCALFLIQMAVALPVVVFAEDAADVPVPNVGNITTDVTVPAEPFTWSYLATIGGAATFTLLVVQFLKAPLDKVWKIPTRFLAYVIALAIMLAATALTTGLNIDSFLLAVVNAILAATSAYGLYEVTFAKLSK